MGACKETEQRLPREVEALLAEAAARDAAEDRQYGRGTRGDELPAELARRESRLVKIREARAALEAEARTEAEVKRLEREVARLKQELAFVKSAAVYFARESR